MLNQSLCNQGNKQDATIRIETLSISGSLAYIKLLKQYHCLTNTSCSWQRRKAKLPVWYSTLAGRQKASRTNRSPKDPGSMQGGAMARPKSAADNDNEGTHGNRGHISSLPATMVSCNTLSFVWNHFNNEISSKSGLKRSIS